MKRLLTAILLTAALNAHAYNDRDVLEMQISGCYAASEMLADKAGWGAGAQYTRIKEIAAVLAKQQGFNYNKTQLSIRGKDAVYQWALNNGWTRERAALDMYERICYPQLTTLAP